MPKLSPEFKAALTAMPVRDKDRLLLRLVAKDAALIDKLTYQLLEGGDDPTERREELRTNMHTALLNASQSRYYTPGYLLLDLRHWNARITEHVRATSDKLGDVELRLWMLNTAVQLNASILQRFPARRAATLAPYLVQRTTYLLGKLTKLHEDYYLDLRQPLQEWLQFVHQYGPTSGLARASGIRRQWEE